MEHCAGVLVTEYRDRATLSLPMNCRALLKCWLISAYTRSSTGRFRYSKMSGKWFWQSRDTFRTCRIEGVSHVSDKVLLHDESCSMVLHVYYTCTAHTTYVVCAVVL